MFLISAFIEQDHNAAWNWVIKCRVKSQNVGSAFRIKLFIALYIIYFYLMLLWSAENQIQKQVSK